MRYRCAREDHHVVIALIGFVNAGFVPRIPDTAGITVPAQRGFGGQLFGWPPLTFVVFCDTGAVKGWAARATLRRPTAPRASRGGAAPPAAA